MHDNPDQIGLDAMVKERDAAQRLGITYYALRRERLEGRIAFKAVGRLIFYAAADLIAWQRSTSCLETGPQPLNASSDAGSYGRLGKSNITRAESVISSPPIREIRKKRRLNSRNSSQSKKTIR